VSRLYSTEAKRPLTLAQKEEVKKAGLWVSELAPYVVGAGLTRAQIDEAEKYTVEEQVTWAREQLARPRLDNHTAAGPDPQNASEATQPPIPAGPPEVSPSSSVSQQTSTEQCIGEGIKCEDKRLNATDATPAGVTAKPTGAEVEKAALRKAARRTAQVGMSPKTASSTVAVIPSPFIENAPSDTGIVAAATHPVFQKSTLTPASDPIEPTLAAQPGRPKAATATRRGPSCVAHSSHPVDGGGAPTQAHHQPSKPQPQSSIGQAEQSGTTRPSFDHTTGLAFYEAVHPSAFILGYTGGRGVSTAEQYQALTQEADRRHEHLFFAVARLNPEWANPNTHEKGKVTTPSKDKAVNISDGSTTHVLECPYLWGDCDATKYEGNNPDEAKAHYEREGIRVKQQVDDGLARLGVRPFAKWRSGAGWQFLIKLDQAIEPEEAEILVGKLHTALGFDPIVRNCNRILRWPGSVNWKDGKNGRVPSPCVPLFLLGTITNVDDIRKVLANVPVPDHPVQPSGLMETDIDWSTVRTAGGWLQSVNDLPADASPKLRRIVGHTGTLAELNSELIGAGLLQRPYRSWSEVTLALTASFKAVGTYTPEQIAEALLANLPCNEHIERQQNKQRAIERAIGRSRAPVEVTTAGSVKFRDFYKDGRPKPSLANAVRALRALGVNARLDLFRRRTDVTYKGQARTISDGLLTDDTVSAARSLINNTYEIDCGEPNTLAAIKEIATENAYDPVLDMLDDFEGRWDGVKRLDAWVVRYLGCADTPLNRAIGRIALTAACRRARDPGCKFDSIIVLEGVEGTGKSTAIRVLAGNEYFSDQSILGARDKEVQEQLVGIWMHENADLAGMKRAEVEQIKAFASRQVDRARPAYGRVREDRPRRSIEWGTTNNDNYLLSQTGNRRFWPLRTGKIDIEALIQDREQLIGEAATYEAAGQSIVLDQSLWSDARAAQEQRRVADPWEDILANMSNWPMQVIHRSGDGFERVATARVLTDVLNIPPAQQTSAVTQRLAHAMEHAGWQRNPGGRVTINGTPVRGYKRPEIVALAGPTGTTGPQAAACGHGALGLTGPRGMGASGMAAVSAHGATGLSGPVGATQTGLAGARGLTGPAGPKGGAAHP
jgi:predicted P-loop ATPase